MENSLRVFKSKLQRQAQTRPLDNTSDTDSLSQYSLHSTPSTQSPRASNVYELDVQGEASSTLNLREPGMTIQTDE
jgi:hypothetical protein